MPKPEFKCQLRRDALYDLVWRVPLSRLAEPFGISDVALRKTCKKLHVPTPPRGYWAKLKHGHEPGRTSLPDWPDGEEEPLHNFGRKSQRQRFTSNQVAIPASVTEPARIKTEKNLHEFAGREAPSVPKIKVRSTFRGAHPIVRKTRRIIERRKSDRYGRVAAFEEGTLTISVCPSSLCRALLVGDALFRGAVKMGYDVEGQAWCNVRGRDWSALIVEDERIRFRIKEKVRQEKKRLEKESWGRKWEYHYHPTGQLEIELQTLSLYHGKSGWKDGKKKLEDQIGIVLKGFWHAAQAAKRRRKEEVERRRRQEEKERKKREAERLLQLEETRRENLENQSTRWHKSKRLSAYVDEVERSTSCPALTDEDERRYREWLTWAREHAQRLNPLSDAAPYKDQ